MMEHLFQKTVEGRKQQKRQEMSSRDREREREREDRERERIKERERDRVGSSSSRDRGRDRDRDRSHRRSRSSSRGRSEKRSRSRSKSHSSRYFMLSCLSLLSVASRLAQGLTASCSMGSRGSLLAKLLGREGSHMHASGAEAKSGGTVPQFSQLVLITQCLAQQGDKIFKSVCSSPHNLSYGIHASSFPVSIIWKVKMPKT
jgi:hypothetical protein